MSKDSRTPLLRIVADDFGLHESVNRGILDLADAGAIDAVSVMFHKNANLDLLDALVATGVQIGCHLVLVEEQPCSHLAPSPLPTNYRELFSRSALDNGTKRWVFAEADAQIKRAIARGIQLGFLNSHQHVHLFPSLWKTLVPIFRAYHIPVRCCVQIRPGPIKQMAVELSSLVSLMTAPSPGVPLIHPLGIQDAGYADENTARNVADRAARLPQNAQAEFVIHPGFESPDLAARYAHWNYSWNEEWTLSKSGSFRQAMLQRLESR
jgi:predicted glycoside hydrolase/deacetylase ChbG (UPF0249 family)